MNTPRVMIGLVILAAMLVLMVGLSQAQVPNPHPSLAPQMPSDTNTLAALGAAFTYQGQLKKDGQLISGDCEMAFRLHDAASAGNQVGGPITRTVTISNGLFTEALDFGPGAFDGNNRWLAIEVKCGSESAYTPLGRQAITAAPYALYAGSAPWSGLTDVPAGFADGVDDDTTYSAGYGLGLSANTFNVATATIQARVGAACGAGYAIRQVNTDGSVVCEADDDTTYTAGAGLVMTGTQLSVDYTAVAPLAHTHTFTCPDTLKYFEEEWAIPTSGAFDWEYFTIGSDAYLAVANRTSGATYNIDSKIYRWNGTVFSETQSTPTNAASDWEFFTIGSDAYLAVANETNGSTYNINSKLYRWNGASFIEAQSVPTNGARDWEFFIIGSDYYLAVANYYNDSTNNINSKIYRWDGASFVDFQSIPTSGATDWEFFTLGSDSYLAVANIFNGSTYNINSKLYRWNGTVFSETQSIPTNGAHDWEFFTIGSDAYLVAANFYNDSTGNINSTVYSWNGASFVEFLSIPTNYVTDWEFFTLGSDSYLAVANRFSPSKLYRWNGTSLAEVQPIPTNDAYAWEFFTLGSSAYLAVANSSPPNISKIYKAALQNCGGVVGYPPGSGGTYLQLDTLTAAPPAHDCDEAAERGRMKVDIVHNRLYICMNSGWVTK